MTSRRPLFAFIATTLNGYVAGPDGALDWQLRDAETDGLLLEQLAEVDSVLLGRVTYEAISAHWPHASRTTDDEVARALWTIPSHVVSSTLTTADWGNATVLGTDLPAAVEHLTDGPGTGVAVLGSSRLTSALLALGLLDELRLLVHPVVLPSGRRLLEEIDVRADLTPRAVRHLASGAALLTYDARERAPEPDPALGPTPQSIEHAVALLMGGHSLP